MAKDIERGNKTIANRMANIEPNDRWFSPLLFIISRRMALGGRKEP